MYASRVVEVVEEAPEVRTVVVECPRVAVKARPGNFIMVWHPEVEEVPMSPSLIRPPRLVGFTVKAVGDTTRRLTQLSPGEVVYVRGPYGRGFTLERVNAVLVGGGVGAAPLLPLAERLKELGSRVEAIVAARTSRELIFKDRLSRVVDELVVATDDGSEGLKGMAHEALAQVLDRSRHDRVYVCGPEPMIARCVELAIERGVDLEASLERYIKCGVGLCGSCSIDGLRVCVDGPVFKLAELARMRELGRFKRDAAGRRVAIE